MDGITSIRNDKLITLHTYNKENSSVSFKIKTGDYLNLIIKILYHPTFSREGGLKDLVVG
jgi:transcriptional regulator